MSNEFNKQIFIQKYFPNTYHWELTDSELLIKRTNLFSGSVQRTLRLDEVSHRYEIQESNFSSLNFFAFFLVIIFVYLLSYADNALILAVLVLFASPVLLGYYFANHKAIMLSAKNEPLTFFFQKKDQVAVEAFVREIIQSSKKYLIWKYGQVDADLDKNLQIRNYKWLRDNAIINDEEYQSLKSQLKEVLQKENK